MLVNVLCVQAQNCTYSIKGHVYDVAHHEVQGAVVRMVADSAKGAVADSLGHFQIDNVCKGHTVLTCSYMGYTPAQVHVDVIGDVEVTITLSEDKRQLHEVIVNGSKLQDIHTLSQVQLKGQAMFRARGKSLGDALKELPGLNATQTGPTLSKPIIHGMHSNRVLIVNNGVRQEGQQWGAEHAPELDPFTAGRISVLKGAASVRYGSDAVAGVILLEPDKLPEEPGVNGDVYAVAGSNGRMGALSATLQGAQKGLLKGLSWRVQGTAKGAGNFSNAKYMMNNTGTRELNGLATVGYQWRNWNLSALYSHYEVMNGIYTGSHVGNISDLLAAFKRDGPVGDPRFTYDIVRSYQQVYHDLAKATLVGKFKNEGRLEVNAARQYDLRNEYDVSLPYTNNKAELQKPQVSFQLITHTADVTYLQPNKNGFSGSVGISGITQGNVFRGIRYLIPNFRNYGAGAFAIERYSKGKFTLETGLRYDYRWLRVYQLNANTLKTYNTTRTFNNITATGGVAYHPTAAWNISLNTGTAWRAPAVNELYVHGVHFSDARYQNGDSLLDAERAWNTGISTTYQGHRLRVDAEVYYNLIDNYIYDMPTMQPVTLVSGTYPAFQYTQDKVRISGLDVDIHYNITTHWAYEGKLTLVRGYNISRNDYLIYMPADRIQNGIGYSMHSLGKLKEPHVAAEVVAVMKQVRVPHNSDYVAPPEGYGLLNLHAGFDMAVGKDKAMSVDVSVNNVSNVAYREYLDHFRYYTYQLGRNVQLRVKYSF